MNIPALITLVRLLTGIVSFIFMFLNYWVLGSVFILLAVLLDIADGKIARALKQATKSGVFLDIMVDKIVIIGTYFIVGAKINVLFFYFGLLILLREYSMDTLRTIAASEKIILSADKLSKIKGTFYMTAMVGMVFNFALLNNNAAVQAIMIVLAACGIILAYASLTRLVLKYRKKFNLI
jgi:CDP-diacylglycerol--glycerol-3-phosphate 3-phosphatidyltransferase